jgi:hypothetical protein
MARNGKPFRTRQGQADGSDQPPFNAQPNRPIPMRRPGAADGASRFIADAKAAT